MVRRPNADLEFVRVSIGRELSALYYGIVSEAIPESMTDLLKQLDQPTESDRDNDKSASDITSGCTNSS
jgi:Anti-sigma factor NepR